MPYADFLELDVPRLYLMLFLKLVSQTYLPKVSVKYLNVLWMAFKEVDPDDGASFMPPSPDTLFLYWSMTPQQFNQILELSVKYYKLMVFT